jgi:hypothetical protein
MFLRSGHHIGREGGTFMNLKEVFSRVDLHEGCGVTERPLTTFERFIRDRILKEDSQVSLFITTETTPLWRMTLSSCCFQI